MTKKRHYRTFRKVEEDYFRSHPEEVGPYMDAIFDAYAEDGDSAALLASLRVLAKVKGVIHLAEAAGMTRQGIQRALSSKGNPRFDNIHTILHVLGYRLMPAPMERGMKGVTRREAPAGMSST